MLLSKKILTAQTWQYPYNSSDNFWPISTTEINSDQSIIISGLLENSIFNKSNGIIILLDKNGNLIQKKELQFNGYSNAILGFAGSDSINSTKTFIGLKTDTMPPYISSFSSITLDTNLNILNTKDYYLPIGTANLVIYTNYSKDKDFIIVGQIFDTLNNSTNLIYVFKQNGDSLVATKFNNFPNLFLHDCISDKTTGGYKAISEPYQFTRARVFQFDSTLAFKQLDTVIFFQGLGHTNGGKYSFKDLNDSIYLIAGGYYITILTTNQDVSISKIKTSTNSIIQEQNTGRPVTEKPATLRALDFVSPSNIYLGAISNYNGPFANDSNYIMITDFDSNLTIKWQRFIGGDATYSLYSVTATTDGGCLLSTTIYDATTATYPGQSNAIFFKIDSIGTLTNTNKNAKFQLYKFIIYPNPSDGNLHIAGYIKNTIKVEIYNELGKLVYYKDNYSTGDEINTDKLKHGIYIYKIIDGGNVEQGKWIKN